MGGMLPLPTGTLYQVQHKYWPDDDVSGAHLSDQQRMQRQDAAYHGRFPSPLKRSSANAANEPDHNVIDNRCEPIVATGVDFLYGDDVSFEVTNDDGSEDEAAQEYLDAVWEANTKMPLLAEYEINSGTFGHAFLKLIPDDPDTAPYPAIAVLNPLQMGVMTRPADVRKVERYTFTYRDMDDTGAACECRQVTERTPEGGWVIHDQIRRGGFAPITPAGASSALDTAAYSSFSSSVYSQTTADPDMGWEEMEGSPTPWRYPWSPIHDGKNLPQPNSYWGKADLRLDIIHLNEALNFLLSNRQRILYFHGHPKDVFFGIRAHEINVDPGGSITIPNINARVQHIEMTGDLAAIEKAIEEIRESMDELSHVPSVAVGRLKNLPGVPSGVSLKVAYRPLIAQTLTKRNLRKSVFVPLCQHILELGGYGKSRKVTVHWPEMLPTDEKEDAQTALIDKQIGASDDTLLRRRGYDPDVEREKNKEAEEEQLNAFAQGQGLPPPPPGVPPMQPGIHGVSAARELNAFQQADQQQSPMGPPQTPQAPQQAPPVNHPAAVAMRHRMQQAGQRTGQRNGR